MKQILKMKLIITLFATITTSICFSQEIDFSKNELIVEFKANNNLNKSLSLRTNKRLNIINDSLQLESFKIIGNKIDNNTFLLKFKNNIDIKNAISVYNKTNLYTYIEPNYIGKSDGFLQTTPNDPLYYKQWPHNNDGTFPLSPAKIGADISTPLAWNITQGDPNLIVAILDSGIKLDHPEFSGRIVPGWDFVNNDADPTDDYGHGTNVAGIALATGNNAIGFAGVNWNSKIMACKITDNKGTGYYSGWIDAIYFAVDHGAKVINISAGGLSPSTLLENAINYAYNNNVIVVCSVGNSNSLINQYPAKYANTITVGATNPDDTRSTPFCYSSTTITGSNFGPELQFVAPGNYIWGLNYLSNTVYNSYWGGTSQAAPVVTGVVSLLLSINPSLSVSQIKLILQQSSQDQVGDSFDTLGWDQYYGYGRINAFKAVSHPLLATTQYYKESTSIKIFPNPITNENIFTISGLATNSNYDIKMVSLDGQIVKEIKKSSTNEPLKIETELLQSGIYLVNIYDINNKLTFNKKIIKQ